MVEEMGYVLQVDGECRRRKAVEPMIRVAGQQRHAAMAPMKAFPRSDRLGEHG
ncbi:hypothetical protein RLDS_03525 [Sphingobium lactosutens DS20]|uniref:Uncharacterized protein n=1 Tax=Sphingobium lactosutens DS20 TaxID=1331060 RepID=T0I0U0_9SPHN|nr:hypothetical protein RLDS_03525 [Sphingobium lactosutens DS20]